MKVFVGILFNALMLFIIQYFIPYNETLKEGVLVTGGITTYIIGGVILGVLNFTVKPILKIFGFPLIILTLGLFSLVINGILLLLIQKIIYVLNVNGSTYEINGALNFIIAVAIFTIFNTIYSVLIKK
ncbi:MAG: phage holin family protein [Candidatus Gracilibacteria bacterium]|nr:phage holin family protein [Candidatus Gracilibacteria bacterium]MDD4530749.1 phage holin family protein [Candidatus Gracilibacteria bacterium]